MLCYVMRKCQSDKQLAENSFGSTALYPFKIGNRKLVAHLSQVSIKNKRKTENPLDRQQCTLSELEIESIFFSRRDPPPHPTSSCVVAHLSQVSMKKRKNEIFWIDSSVPFQNWTSKAFFSRGETPDLFSKTFTSKRNFRHVWSYLIRRSLKS